jgi:polyferredoxin
MSPESVYSLLTLAFGFAVAGMLGTFYQLVTTRPPSFRLLVAPATPSAVVALPFLIFTAPFIIMRNTIRGAQIEDRNFGFAMLATMIAGIWSLLSGTLVVKVIETLGTLVA